MLQMDTELFYSVCPGSLFQIVGQHSRFGFTFCFVLPLEQHNDSEPSFCELNDQIIDSYCWMDIGILFYSDRPGKPFAELHVWICITLNIPTESLGLRLWLSWIELVEFFYHIIIF